jgi:pimeloyl-ACP methyl ester carboxylesterase
MLAVDLAWCACSPTFGQPPRGRAPIHSIYREKSTTCFNYVSCGVCQVVEAWIGQGPKLPGLLQFFLFGDYKSNVALYPTFQKYFRTYKPPLLAVWGKNDPFFLPRGAEAFKRDIPDAVVGFFDTGHFALETHAGEIAAAIRDLLPG